mmetsp:Transcript_14238/g.29865  ORF Transcript_14238/g.29865 Transcript_14238/m.29865 type:complete len:315 (-) Transcript_14238:777-1721(-)
MSSKLHNGSFKSAPCNWTSMLGSKLCLCDPSTHDARGGGPSRDDVAGLVDDLGAAPLLVGEGLYAILPLLALDQLHVGCRAALGIVPREEVDAERVAVEARQRDELPAEAHLCQVPDEGLHLGVRHAGGVPVEGRAEVVGQHLVGHSRAHLRCELGSLAQDGLASLHPDAVGVRREGNGALDAIVGGALDPEVALNRASEIPVEEDIPGAEACRRLPHLRQRHLQAVLEPLAGIDAFGLQDLGHGIWVCHAAGALLPIFVCALLDCLVQWFNTCHCCALDVRMVDGVNVGVNHGGCLGISASNQDQGRVEDVSL